MDTWDNSHFLLQELVKMRIAMSVSSIAPEWMTMKCRMSETIVNKRTLSALHVIPVPAGVMTVWAGRQDAGCCPW
jgi:hypothetical protein